MRTAKFWTYINGDFVKVKLADGDSLYWRQARSTDEGWASEELKFTFEGGQVMQTYHSDCTDCDGRHQYTSRQRCPIDLLTSSEDYDGHHRLPAWCDAGGSQRDFAAESMGY